MIGYRARVSRRQTLTWLVSAVGASRLPLAFGAQGSSTSSGYGFDPRLDQYVAPWPRILEIAELNQIAVFADLALPAPTQDLMPSALGVPEFIDEWVSAPYDLQQQDLVIIRQGLRWLDAQSNHRFGSRWIDSPRPAQNQLLTALAESHPRGEFAEQRAFFCRLRQLLVSAYFTTDAGLKAVGYVGNVPLNEFPPVSGELATVLESRLNALGI